MSDNLNRPSLSLPSPVIARFLAPGGAHVVVAGAVEDRTLVMACEGCGRGAGPFTTSEHDLSSKDTVHRALAQGQRHAETCRRIPVRLWPENAGGAK